MFIHLLAALGSLLMCLDFFSSGGAEAALQLRCRGCSSWKLLVADPALACRLATSVHVSYLDGHTCFKGFLNVSSETVTTVIKFVEYLQRIRHHARSLSEFFDLSQSKSVDVCCISSDSTDANL